MEIPKEHQMICPNCGGIIDLRDLGQVITHEFNGCDPIQVPYSSSRKIGDPVEWTDDKKPLNLN